MDSGDDEKGPDLGRGAETGPDAGPETNQGPAQHRAHGGGSSGKRSAAGDTHSTTGDNFSAGNTHLAKRMRPSRASAVTGRQRIQAQAQRGPDGWGSDEDPDDNGTGLGRAIVDDSDSNSEGSGTQGWSRSGNPRKRKARAQRRGPKDKALFQLTALPTELLSSILAMVEPAVLMTLSATCRFFHRLLDETPGFWKDAWTRFTLGEGIDLTSSTVVHSSTRHSDAHMHIEDLRRTRRNHPDMLMPPPKACLALVLYRTCMVCGKPKIRKVHWEFALRCCDACFDAVTVAEDWATGNEIPPASYAHLPYTDDPSCRLLLKRDMLNVYHAAHPSRGPPQDFHNADRLREREKESRELARRSLESAGMRAIRDLFRKNKDAGLKFEPVFLRQCLIWHQWGNPRLLGPQPPRFPLFQSAQDMAQAIMPQYLAAEELCRREWLYSIERGKAEAAAALVATTNLGRQERLKAALLHAILPAIPDATLDLDLLATCTMWKQWLARALPLPAMPNEPGPPPTSWKLWEYVPEFPGNAIEGVSAPTGPSTAKEGPDGSLAAAGATTPPGEPCRSAANAPGTQGAAAPTSTNGDSALPTPAAPRCPPAVSAAFEDSEMAEKRPGPAVTHPLTPWKMREALPLLAAEYLGRLKAPVLAPKTSASKDARCSVLVDLHILKGRLLFRCLVEDMQVFPTDEVDWQIVESLPAWDIWMQLLETPCAPYTCLMGPSFCAPLPDVETLRSTTDLGQLEPICWRSMQWQAGMDGPGRAFAEDAMVQYLLVMNVLTLRKKQALVIRRGARAAWKNPEQAQAAALDDARAGLLSKFDVRLQAAIRAAGTPHVFACPFCSSTTFNSSREFHYHLRSVHRDLNIQPDLDIDLHAPSRKRDLLVLAAPEPDFVAEPKSPLLCRLLETPTHRLTDFWPLRPLPDRHRHSQAAQDYAAKYAARVEQGQNTLKLLTEALAEHHGKPVHLDPVLLARCSSRECGSSQSAQVDVSALLAEYLAAEQDKAARAAHIAALSQAWKSPDSAVAAAQAAASAVLLTIQEVELQARARGRTGSASRLVCPLCPSPAEYATTFGLGAHVTARHPTIIPRIPMLYVQHDEGMGAALDEYMGRALNAKGKGKYAAPVTSPATATRASLFQEPDLSAEYVEFAQNQSMQLLMHIVPTVAVFSRTNPLSLASLRRAAATKDLARGKRWTLTAFVCALLCEHVGRHPMVASSSPAPAPPHFCLPTRALPSGVLAPERVKRVQTALRAAQKQWADPVRAREICERRVFVASPDSLTGVAEVVGGRSADTGEVQGLDEDQTNGKGKGKPRSQTKAKDKRKVKTESVGHCTRTPPAPLTPMSWYDLVLEARARSRRLPTNFVCPLCEGSRRFILLTSLLEHVQTHHVFMASLLLTE